MANILDRFSKGTSNDQPVYSTNASTNDGPHDSNLANKVDPRVDSDRDGRFADATSMNNDTPMKYAETGSYGTTSGTTFGSSNAGPHNSNLGNKMDPRVDSDLDGRAAHGHAGYATTRTSDNSAANNGPHSSKLMNKLDPQVDSDRDGHNDSFGAQPTTTKTFEQAQTQGTSTSGTAGTNSAYGLGSTNQGPHNSNMMNKMDPRVDSDMDHRARHQHMGNTTTNPTTNTNTGSTTAAAPAGSSYATTGAGETHGTTNATGPHHSKLLNKLDPRVDSSATNVAPGAQR